MNAFSSIKDLLTVKRAIEVFFVDKLREETRFAKVEDLMNQLTKDVDCAKKLLKTV